MQTIVSVQLKSNGTFTFDTPNKVGVSWSDATKLAADIRTVAAALGLDDNPNSSELRKRIKTHLLGIPHDRFPMHICPDPIPAPRQVKTDNIMLVASFHKLTGHSFVQCCGKEGCTVQVLNSRRYCSKYHNKCEFLYNTAEKFRKQGDTFGQTLCETFLQDICEGSANPLQPKRALSNVPRFQLSNDMLDFYLKYIDVLLVFLGVNVDGGLSASLKDQKKRAETLANLLTDDHTVLRLMDGHCGFTMLVLHEIRQRYGADRLNKLVVELVDNDNGVTLWHAAMFRCSNFHCITDQIIDPQKRIPKNTLLYMNFCGIKDSFSDVCVFLELQFRVGRSERHACMLSFSISRRAKTKDYQKSLAWYSFRSGWDMSPVETERRDFATLVIGPKP